MYLLLDVCVCDENSAIWIRCIINRSKVRIFFIELKKSIKSKETV